MLQLITSCTKVALELFSKQVRLGANSNKLQFGPHTKIQYIFLPLSLSY